ncbi:MAG: hypothetical protein AB1346_00545 [Thermodesulfobacteriota bacterium]
MKPGMEEFEFIEEIDDNFIYDTDPEYEEAARIGCSISDNAALMVGYELAKGGSLASPEVNLRILEILEKERPTPVVLAALPVVKALLEKRAADREDVVKLLSACNEHTSAWSGLGIVLCADESLEPEVDAIMARWREAPPKKA